MRNMIWLAYNGPHKPQYATSGSAGCDITSNEDVILPPGGRAAVGTGLSLAIPEDYVGMVCPRSGLALKHGVTVLNAPGIIDSDYRGEVKVILINLSQQEYSVKKGDRIAQLILTPVFQSRLRETEALSGTDRGSGGFGSTGT